MAPTLQRSPIFDVAAHQIVNSCDYSMLQTHIKQIPPLDQKIDVHFMLGWLPTIGNFPPLLNCLIDIFPVLGGLGVVFKVEIAGLALVGEETLLHVDEIIHLMMDYKLI